VPADGLAFGRVDACARVEAAFEQLAAAGSPVDLVILSGDLADRGDESAYARLRSVLAPGVRTLGARLLVVPGNHDDVGLLRSVLLELEPGDGPLDSVIRIGGDTSDRTRLERAGCRSRRGERRSAPVAHGRARTACG
jgi:3',5'-cyclic-AMP phosphodiesterase